MATPTHVEISCLGADLSISVNGQVVSSVHDTSYTAGNFVFSGVGGARGAPADARISHLVITQR